LPPGQGIRSKDNEHGQYDEDEVHGGVIGSGDEDAAALVEAVALVGGLENFPVVGDGAALGEEHDEVADHAEEVEDDEEDDEFANAVGDGGGEAVD